MPIEESYDGFDSLTELALDLRWSWHHGTDEIWRRLNPALWNHNGNPYAVLQSVSRGEIERQLGDASFRTLVDAALEAKRRAAAAPGWFQQAHPQAPLTTVAYFSMEFMLSEALPIYSGGLGNVAGDQLKAASDLGVPVVGVGLLYQQGYFRQAIDKGGAQQALFPHNDPAQMPITPVREASGEWLRIEIALPGYTVWLRAWQVQVGRARLYLLDSNDAANVPAHRGITGELYGGGPELRLQQELALGIGGWRLLRALGIQPEVCHLNEGHAAFAVLERARSFMEENAQPFEVALAVTRAGNLFTTHTAVAAGFDRFSPALIEQYLGRYAETKLGLKRVDLLALGRQNSGDSSETFNTAHLAIRGSGSVNGVSRLHGQVSRQLFAPLFPRWPLDEMPIGHVTNGVHVPTWDSLEADALWTEACGKGRWLGATEELEHEIRKISDTKLWQLRCESRKSVVEYAHEHVARDMAAGGASPEAIGRTKQRLNPDVLTLGFARRFAAYKRPNLLLHDPGRLLRLLGDPERPVQLILAGKAHPADQAGQKLIQEWTHFIHQTDPSPPVVFLADYDMRLAESLVRGVDVWINTPRRPWEASGTSGMKVLVNGGINLSELDGWWAEAYAPELGWALGDGHEHGNDPMWDAAEAGALYERLEHEVIPEFYARDSSGIPVAWVARMRESMARLTPRFSSNRAVREYTTDHYLPAAAAFRKRAADKGAVGREMVEWRCALEEMWPRLSFGPAKVETDGERHALEIPVYLGGLEANAVQVQLYADGINGEAPVCQEMARIRQLTGAAGGYVYGARVPATRPARDFTARVVPRHEGTSAPLEASEILWQR
ncbi:MAG: alpha-glucan family phosphorylase [Opitutaceae bacterium]